MSEQGCPVACGQWACDHQMRTSYSVPMQNFVYEPTERDPDVWDQVFGGGASLMWMYVEGQCVGSLQLIDGQWQSFPLTQVWEGDQA